MGNNTGGVGVAGTYNLSGGTLTVNSMNKGTRTGTFNFNGGTLKAGGSSATFMTGLTTANMKAGGAIIDDGGFAITIGQALVNNSGGGQRRHARDSHHLHWRGQLRRCGHRQT